MNGTGLALGVFLGNWLLVPLIFREKSFKEGFRVGLIAATLVLGFYALRGF